MNKRLGAHFESKPQGAAFRFPQGLGLVVAEELKALLACPFVPLKFPVKLSATAKHVAIDNASLRTLTELCLRATTVKDLIWDLGETKVVFETEIDRAITRIPWSRILPADCRLSLRVSTSESRLFHTGLIAERVERSLAKLGLVVVAKGQGESCVDLRLKNNRLAVGLSLAGAPLNHRDYRENLSHQAPLNECLAAAVIRFAIDAAPKPASTMLDIHVPFAGSGTFGFEALLCFGNLAPCLFRKKYALEDFCGASEKSILHIRSKARRQADLHSTALFFQDIDPVACRALAVHSESFCSRLEQLGLQAPQIAVEKGDFFELQEVPEGTADTCLLLNPPYGHRLGAENNFYRELGNKTRQLYAKRGKPVWGVALLPPGKPAELFRQTLKASHYQERSVRNGGIATRALVFVI